MHTDTPFIHDTLSPHTPYIYIIQQDIQHTAMVKHIILWTLNPELSEEEKQNIKLSIKQGLEALVGVVPGLIEATVHIDGRLESSNADIMLDSTLENEEALKGYAIHPAHVEVASQKVRPFTVQRVCLDFETDNR